MNRLLKIISSIPKTIWFNFRYFPLSQAFKLPVWVATNVRVKELHRGKLILKGSPKVGMIRIGYHEADGVDTYSAHTILNVNKTGKIIFKNDAHIGQGAILRVKGGAQLSVGNNFAISGNTSIICSKLISFGDDVQLSWNSLIMDSDAHKIFDAEGNWINPPKEIIIGNKVWIAANTTIMKGTKIADNVVVAGNSVVNKAFKEGNVIIGGQPAKVLKSFGNFTI